MGTERIAPWTSSRRRRRTRMHRLRSVSGGQHTLLAWKKQVRTIPHHVTLFGSPRIPVVSLEDVVVQLQDSCREHKAETEALQQEVRLLKHEGKEREKMWKALWYAERTRQHPARPDEPPPIPDSVLFGAVPVSPTITAQPSPTLTQSSNHYHSSIADNGSAPYGGAAYATTGYPSSSSSHAYANSHAGYRPQPQQQAHMSHDQTNNRYVPYGPYMMPASSSMRDSSSSWQAVSPTESAPSTTPPVQSPMAYSDPSNMMYSHRYMMGEHPQPMANIDTSGYVMEQSPSNSAPSTPISTASAAVGPGYSYGLMDSQEHHTAVYPRATGVSMTLHGGLADVSASLSSSRSFRPPGKIADSLPSYHTHTSPPSRVLTSPAEPLQEGKVASSSSRSRDSPDRSPSPSSDPHLSSTLAVIKQQAFGTMRRSNRTRSKVSTTNAKKAIEKLEARGADLGLRRMPKRQRTESDEEDEMHDER
jgi:hypothetical protein